jgi:hypothetical protein
MSSSLLKELFDSQRKRIVNNLKLVYRSEMLDGGHFTRYLTYYIVPIFFFQSSTAHTCISISLSDEIQTLTFKKGLNVHTTCGMWHV